MSSPTSTGTSDPTLLDRLKQLSKKGHEFSSRSDIKLGQLILWSGSVRANLVKIFEPSHPICEAFVPGKIDKHQNVQSSLKERLEQLDALVVKLDHVAVAKNGRVFIGHGQSPIWRVLKDFLQDQLDLRWEEFNREAVAGLTTFERITVMLDTASFAFLIMTAEDEHADAKLHARENVVHEIGLFQGKLGTKRAIILLEDGCTEFSNIVGLSQIRFPKGKIEACFEEIRRVLKREKVT